MFRFGGQSFAGIRLMFIDSKTHDLPAGWDSADLEDIEAFIELGFFTLIARTAKQIDFNVNTIAIRKALRPDESIMTQNSISPQAKIPDEIKTSLTSFQAEYPDANRTGFIMMRFGKTLAHNSIVSAIKETLKKSSLTGVRADDKDYNDSVLPNVQTYMHRCGFGIAVFERIEEESFNPNIALEVGYMLALGKPVCLLKDKNLKSLQTDLIGKLYRSFDILEPLETIPPELENWLEDRHLK